METLNLKVRIAVLWIFMAVAMSAHGVLSFIEPGMISQIMSGEIEGMAIGPGMLFFMSLFWVIPLAMAYLSVTLNDRLNRNANMVLGLIFVFLNIFHLSGHLASASAHQSLIIGLTVVVAAMIFWHSWKWPKK